MRVAGLAAVMLALAAFSHEDDDEVRPLVPADGVVRLDPTSGPEQIEAVIEGLHDSPGATLAWMHVLSPQAVAHRRGTASAPAQAAKAAAGEYSAADVQISDPSLDGYPANFHAEPSIAANGARVLVAYNDGGDDAGSSNPGTGVNVDGFATSSDAGATFIDRGKRPAPAATPSSQGDIDAYDGDNVVAAGALADEFFYLSDGGALTCYTAPCPPNTLYNGYFNAPVVSRSLDGGVTWSDPVDASNGAGSGPAYVFFDKGWIATDTFAGSPHFGNVYVSWSDFAAGTSGMNTDVWISWSDDQGATWHPQIVSHRTGPDGVVAPSYIQAGPDGRVFLGVQVEPDGSGGGSNFVYVSTDGGASWSAPHPVASYQPAGNARAEALCKPAAGGFVGIVHYLNGPIEADSSLRLAVNPADPDNVVVVNHARGSTAGDDADVFLWRSTDGGASWSGPVRVNDDSTRTDQFMPDLWFAPDGTLAVMWLDRRHDTTDNWKLETWMARSDDGGASFGPSFPVSSAPFSPIGRCQMSDYNALHADASKYVMAWGDGRASDPMDQQSFVIRGATLPHDGPGAILDVAQVSGPGQGAAPGHFEVLLRNDGLRPASGLSLHFTASNATGTGADQTLALADLAPGHATATADFIMPAAISGSELHGQLTVTGDQGSSSWPLTVAKLPGSMISLLDTDFESGLPAGWSTDQGLIDQGGSKSIDDRWQVTSACAAPDPGHSGTQVAYFGDASLCAYGTQTYAPPAPVPPSDYVYATLTTPSLHLPAGDAALTFREWVGIPYRFIPASGQPPSRGADVTVQISTDGGRSFERIWGYGKMSRHVLDPAIPLRDSGNDYEGEPLWHDVSVDLSPYAGQDVIVRFFFEGSQWQAPGYAIDDVAIQGRQGLDAGASPAGGDIPALGWLAAAALAVLLALAGWQALRRRRSSRPG